MKIPNRELRNVAVTVKLTASERTKLALLGKFHQASNADVLASLINEEVERMAAKGVSLEESVSKMGTDFTTAPPLPGEEKNTHNAATLDQLAEQIAQVAAAVEQLRKGQ